MEMPKTFEEKIVRACVGCLVLSERGQIVLQQRDADSVTFPDCLATFGGGIDPGETPMETLIRELKEELGAEVKAEDVVRLGVLTEDVADGDIEYVFFWHDKFGSITGCYEGQAMYYDDAASVASHPKVMDDVRWLLREGKKRKLIK
jgi:8-oxo-dGTP diphosphatase